MELPILKNACDVAIQVGHSGLRGKCMLVETSTFVQWLGIRSFSVSRLCIHLAPAFTVILSVRLNRYI